MKIGPYLVGGSIALVVTVASGAIHARLSNRWGSPPNLEAAGARLAAIPTSFGDWTLVSEREMDDDAVRLLQCTGYIYRVYQNSRNPQWPPVQVAVLVGPAGPISVHTPEICYSSRDYTVDGPRRHVSVQVPGEPEAHELWGVTMSPVDKARARLRVYYGWTIRAPWQAPDYPRFRYGGEPILYKIQLAGELPPDSSSGDSESITSFLREFLPVVNGIAFASASQ